MKKMIKDCTEEEIFKSDIAMAKLARLQILGQECGSNLNETYNCLKAGLELLEFEIEVEE